MKIIITFLMVFFSSICFSGENEIFSPSTSFTVDGEKTDYGEIKFKGQAVVSGEIVFVFDMLSENKVGEPMFAKFTPDKNSISLFPQVVSGYFARPLTSIDVSNVDESLVLVFGKDVATKLVGGNQRLVSVKGVFSVTNYRTSVECDARHYIAKIESFKSNTKELALVFPKESPGGC